MPEFVGTTWAAVEPGMTVIDRAGSARLVLDITLLHNPTGAYDILRVTDASGTYELDPDRPALIMQATMQDAVIEILVAFPGSEIIA